MGLKDGVPADRGDEVQKLWALAMKIEIKHNGWMLSSTVDRIGFAMTLSIAFTAIFGTLIWGYGDIFITCDPENACVS